MTKSILFFCLALTVMLVFGLKFSTRTLSFPNESATHLSLHIKGDTMKLDTDQSIHSKSATDTNVSVMDGERENTEDHPEPRENVSPVQENPELLAMDFPLKDIEAKVLKAAAKSPQEALALLADKIEKEAMKTLASTGKMKNRSYVPLTESIAILDDHYGLPKYIPSSLNVFLQMKDSDQPLGNPADILVAIEAGISILRALHAVPRQVTWVVDTEIALYSDPQATEKLPGVKGVLVKSLTITRTVYHLLPTTKTHFVRGHRVAWEWEPTHFWEEVWYKDPNTGKIKLAWTSAAEFIGQDLEHLY